MLPVVQNGEVKASKVITRNYESERFDREVAPIRVTVVWCCLPHAMQAASRPLHVEETEHLFETAMRAYARTTGG